MILPAFGVTIELLEQLVARGCTLVDTTCGSVLNVWKNVKRYADDGFTSVIHGKYWHEETRATASQACRAGAATTSWSSTGPKRSPVCGYIRDGGDRAAFLDAFEHARLAGFDPDAICSASAAPTRRRCSARSRSRSARCSAQRCATVTGTAQLADRFRAFDTICSATQDRQDAILALLDEQPLDLMLVIGGYNSSNTCNLARMCADRVPTYHIADPDGLVSPDAIRHRNVAKPGRHDDPVAARRRRRHRPDVRRLDARQHRRAGRPAPR